MPKFKKAIPHRDSHTLIPELDKYEGWSPRELLAELQRRYNEVDYVELIRDLYTQKD